MLYSCAPQVPLRRGRGNSPRVQAQKVEEAQHGSARGSHLPARRSVVIFLIKAAGQTKERRNWKGGVGVQRSHWSGPRLGSISGVVEPRDMQPRSMEAALRRIGVLRDSHVLALLTTSLSAASRANVASRGAMYFSWTYGQLAVSLCTEAGGTIWS